MKAKRLLPLVLLSLALVLWECKHEDCCVDLTKKYTNGIFVVNEGPFGGTGTITWHNPSTGEVVPDVFGAANGGASLGQFVQSLTFHEDKAYIVVNGAGKIYVVDAETFQFIDTIGGFQQPRYMLAGPDDYAYVSQWGADGLTGSVVKIDLNTRTKSATYPTGKGPEKMLLDGDLLYVANSGGYGVDSTVSIIHLPFGVEFKKIATGGKNPACLDTLSGYSKPFVLCKGYYLDSSPKGYFVNLSPAAQGFDLPAYADDLYASPSKDELFLIAGNAVWRYDSAGSLTKFLDQRAYGFCVDHLTGNLICTDAKDFNSVGEAVIYDKNGVRVSSFPTGIAPGEIVVR